MICFLFHKVGQVLFYSKCFCSYSFFNTTSLILLSWWLALSCLWGHHLKDNFHRHVTFNSGLFYCFINKKMPGSQTLVYKPNISTQQQRKWSVDPPLHLPRSKMVHKSFQTPLCSSLCLSVFIWVSQKSLWITRASWIWTLLSELRFYTLMVLKWQSKQISHRIFPFFLTS